MATRFDVSQRRETLSWSHHAEVAALPAEERAGWLERAEAERMSVRCLRDEIRRAQRAPSHAGQPDEHHELVCPTCGTVLREDGHAVKLLP